MTITRLLLWRHGETLDNREKRFQGQRDSVLAERGWEQARSAAPALAAFQPGIILSSDLVRAANTAGVLAELIEISPRIDKRLREHNLGEWQGLLHSEVERLWPGDLDRRRKDPRWTPPGAESRVEVGERAYEVVTDLCRNADASVHTAVLAAHGGTIAAVTARLLGLPIECWTALGPVSNCHWVDLEFRYDRWRVQGYNVGVAG